MVKVLLMKSPFPGMDPYIEVELWWDFHDNLIAEIERTLAPLLPERYVVRIRERNYISLIGEEKKEAYLPVLPDVALEVSDQAGSVGMLPFIDLRHSENFLEILEAGPEERLVTCIEVLSPSNKRPNTEGWELYLRKRQALLLGAANLVEIDLLRGGRRMPMLSAWPNSPYYILRCRRRRAPYCTAWPAGFRERLPSIPIPLDDPDPDITLDLQPMIEAIYARSRYGRSIDYTRPLTPALEAADASWLASQLQAKGGEAGPQK